MKRTAKVAIVVLVFLMIALDLSSMAEQLEVRIRLIDAHSGKPFVNREVELFGTDARSDLKTRDTLFQLNSKTGADGVAHFRITAPLPYRLLFYSAQANGCGPHGFNSFVTGEVMQSGIVIPNACAGKGEKFDWREVTAQPGEIVIFAVEPRGGW